MHGIAAITGNMHRSLRYFVLLERITSSSSNNSSSDSSSSSSSNSCCGGDRMAFSACNQ